MTKYILLLLLIPTLLLGAGTEYDSTTNPAWEWPDTVTTVNTSGRDFRGYSQHLWIDSSGALFCLYPWGSSGLFHFFGTYNNFTSVWTNAAEPNLGVAAGASFGDSSFIMYHSGTGGVTARCFFAKYNDSARVVLDTIETNTGSSTTPNFWLVGNTMLAYHRRNLDVNQTGILYKAASAIPATTPWTIVDSQNTGGQQWGSGFRWGMPGGICIYLDAQDSIIYADSINGFDTLSGTAIGISPQVTYGTAQAALTYDIDWYRGDTLHIAYMRSESLYYAKFYRSGTFNSQTITLIGSRVCLEDSTQVITPIASGTPGFLYSLPQLQISTVGRGDTVFVFYLLHPDQASPRLPAIYYKMSTNGGTSFGARTLWKDSTSTRKYHQLTTPSVIPRNYPATGQIRLVAAYKDSTDTAARDIIRFYTEILSSSSGAPGHRHEPRGTAVHHSPQGSTARHKP